MTNQDNLNARAAAMMGWTPITSSGPYTQYDKGYGVAGIFLPATDLNAFARVLDSDAVHRFLLGLPVSKAANYLMGWQTTAFEDLPVALEALLDAVEAAR